MAYLIDDRWFQSVFECCEFVHGPVQLRVMLASGHEDRQPHQPAPNAAFQRLETSLVTPDVRRTRAFGSKIASVETRRCRRVLGLASDQGKTASRIRVNIIGRIERQR